MNILFYSPFENDIESDSKIVSLIQNDDYAKLFYGAICNSIWIKDKFKFECSWRYAADFTALLQGLDGNKKYLKFYCSGTEGCSFPEVDIELNRLGWNCIERESKFSY